MKKKIKQVLINNMELFDEGTGLMGIPDIDEKLENIAQEIVKLFAIPDVSNRRELLCAFFKYFRDNGEANIGMTIEEFVDGFLSTQ
jgi:hypothetical protein